jgi:hypothetical protein
MPEHKSGNKLQLCALVYVFKTKMVQRCAVFFTELDKLLSVFFSCLFHRIFRLGNVAPALLVVHNAHVLESFIKFCFRLTDGVKQIKTIYITSELFDVSNFVKSILTFPILMYSHLLCKHELHVFFKPISVFNTVNFNILTQVSWDFKLHCTKLPRMSSVQLFKRSTKQKS